MIADSLRARLGLRREGDERHAVIDIGSNTVRLVIYGGPPRAPAVLWNEKVSARLGRDLAKSGEIPAAAIDDALTALARFAHIVSELGITQVETVATAAPREASNGPEFVRRVEALGLAVRVLSGEEEACASAWGAIGAFPRAQGVVADLGGGSLELVPIADGQCGEGATYPLGTLRLPALRTGGKFAQKVAKLLKGAPAAGGADPLYMIGGTWRAFASYAMRLADHPLSDPHGYSMAASDAVTLAKSLARAKPAQFSQAGISTMRAEKLPDAAALLQVLIEELQPEALVFSSWGLREGLYFRSLPPDEQGMDPLLAGVDHFTAARGGNAADASLIARWTAQVARIAGPATETLRLAAAKLTLALHCVEPNLRGPQALEWALDKRWVGIDFAGRAMLGAALRGSLGVIEPHARLVRLASEGELREATAWGLAFRLAQRLGAGARNPLADSQLRISGDALELRLPDKHSPLISGPINKNLGALATWLGLSPKVTIGD